MRKREVIESGNRCGHLVSGKDRRMLLFAERSPATVIL
jgi:hypothetical protein